MGRQCRPLMDFPITLAVLLEADPGDGKCKRTDNNRRGGKGVRQRIRSFDYIVAQEGRKDWATRYADQPGGEQEYGSQLSPDVVRGYHLQGRWNQNGSE